METFVCTTVGHLGARPGPDDPTGEVALPGGRLDGEPEAEDAE